MFIPAALAVWLALSAALAQSVPTIKVRVDAVRVDVLVLDRGRPVHGLTKEDFELRDNGVAQRIDRVGTEEVPLDVLLMLDSSASVEGEPLERLRRAGRAAVAALRPDDRAGLISFSHRLVPLAPATTDRATLERAIAALTPYGSTALFDALFAGLLQGFDGNRRGLILLCTDAQDTISWLGPEDALESAARSDAVVYAVAPGDRAALRSPTRLGKYATPGAFLEELTRRTGGSLLLADGRRPLEPLFRRIIDEFKQRYQLVYYPEGVPRPGWHAVAVTLRNRKGSVQARRGYSIE